MYHIVRWQATDIQQALLITFLNTGLSDEYAYSKDKAHLENTYMINIKENASDVKKSHKKIWCSGNYV